MKLRGPLYVITDRDLAGGLEHEEIAKRAVEGGADIIQLRDKTMDDRHLLATAVRIREIASSAGALFIVNDRPDIALASCADGVHLGQDDMPLDIVRRMAPKDLIIGVSVGSVEQAVKAEKEGADYIALSPLFDTGSKSDAGKGRGLTMLRSIRDAVQIHLFAIGGVNKENAEDVIMSGADGVAVISAVVSQTDIAAAARELRSELMEALELRNAHRI